MGGGLMQLVAYGAQDIYLTGNPQITFFKVVYRRHTNFSMESIQQTWNGTQAAGARLTATISRNGDLVHKCYVEISGSGTIKQTCCNPGAAIVEQVECEIGGQLIDRQYGHWMETWSELTVPGLDSAHTTGVSHNSSGAVDEVKTNGRCFRATNGTTAHGNNFQNTTGMGGVFNSQEIQAGTAHGGIALSVHGYTVPLYFWFCRNPGLALPLIALQYHEVKINLTLGDSNVLTVPGDLPNITLWVDYIYLDTDERRRFAQVSHEYLIEQLQFQSFGDENTTLNLNFNHPVKELIWTGKWLNASGCAQNTVKSYADSKWLLKLNGHDRFTARNSHYFRFTQVYQHHSGTGSIDYIGDQMGGCTHVYSFALKPEEHQPSGTCNFSRIDSAQLQLTQGTLNPNGIIVYAVNYNVLRIMSGMGGLAYSN
jgi:hypothetical protein